MALTSLTIASDRKDRNFLDDEVAVVRPGRYRIFYECNVGLITSQSEGFWEFNDIESYFRDLEPFLLRARSDFGCLRILADRRLQPVHGAEVANRLGQANRDIPRDGDRVAIVTAGQLTRGQLNRRLSHGETRIFLSYEDAREWLLR